MAALAKFINTVRTDDITSHTHVLLGAPYGKICVSNGKLAEFWDVYTAAVEEEAAIYLAETPLDDVPVLVDVDLKTRHNQYDDLSKHIYTKEQVLRVIDEYQTTLKQVLIDPPAEALTCVLLEKKPYLVEHTGKRYIKNGFHLHFPKCFINRNVQEAYIIPLVKKHLAGLFDNLYTIEGGDGNGETSHLDFIDEASIKVHWLMYGAKKPHMSPYMATKCYLDGCVETDFETALGDYVLPRLDGTRETCSGRVKRLLPRILSIRLHDRFRYCHKTKPSVATPFFDKLVAAKERRLPYVQRTVDADMAEVTTLMPLIHNEDDRDRWLKVGFCLWNVSKGDDEGLMTWIEWSEQSSKYNEAECFCIWGAMRPSSYTIGTLKYFAKQDSPDEYAALCKQKGIQLIDKAVEGGHNDLAKLLYNEYGEEFVYSTSNNMWYKFEAHVWTPCKQNFDLSERISDNNGIIISQFKEHIDRCKSSSSFTRDDDESDKHIKKIQTLEKIIKQCKTSGFKSNVMNECKEVFRNEKFTDKLNTNPNLVAFTNGVYDFLNDKFRDGTPEDYLSKCIPVEYKNYGSVDNPAVMEIESFFHKVFPDDEVRRYFLDQVCQVFVGGNEDKVLLIWTGSGDNGKSVTQHMFEKMLGPLAVKVSTSLITGKKSKMGAAAPELARTGNGVRWLVMDEPSEEEEITTGLLKSLTGNDSYWARDLYQGGEQTKEIIPLYKMHMLCNKLPGIKHPDEAFWNRIRVIPFESKFVAEHLCPPTFEEQVRKKLFPVDRKFTQKIGGLIQPFAWYLISHWRSLKKTDRIVPEKVLIATGNYRDLTTVDPLQVFVEEMLIKTPGRAVSTDDVYNKYKAWFKSEYNGEKCPMKKVVVALLDQYLGDKKGALWPDWLWRHERVFYGKEAE